MTIWVGNTCSHSFGIEKVGKPFFRMGSAKGEYGKKTQKTKQFAYIYSGVKSRGMKQR